MLAAIPPEDDEQLIVELDAIESEWEKVREDSPNIPTKVWAQIELKITFEKDLETHPEFGEKA